MNWGKRVNPLNHSTCEGKGDELTGHLAEHFQEYLIGSLARGIVHNINSPLQVLSMQIEFFHRTLCDDLKNLESLLAGITAPEISRTLKGLGDRCRKNEARIAQMEDILHRIQRMVDILGRRADRDGGPAPFFGDRLVEEEMEFLAADLFYKHSVETKFVCPKRPVLLSGLECNFRDLVDASLVACIEQLRDADERKVLISVDQEATGAFRYTFEHTGALFPAPEDQLEPLKGDASLDLLGLALFVVQEKARSLGYPVVIMPRSISITCG